MRGDWHNPNDISFVATGRATLRLRASDAFHVLRPGANPQRRPRVSDRDGQVVENQGPLSSINTIRPPTPSTANTATGSAPSTSYNPTCSSSRTPKQVSMLQLTFLFRNKNSNK